jgi:spore germination protein GerM
VTARSRRLGQEGVVVVLALGLAACGIPTAGTPTAINKKDVPFHLLSPSSPSTTGSTVPGAVTVQELIYLVSGATQTLAPATRDIAVPPTLNATVTEALVALLQGPTATESDSGLTTYLSSSRTRVSARVSGGIATVDFTTNPIELVGATETLAVAQVVWTATEVSGVTGVLFEIDGQPTPVPTASGATVPGPVDRTFYQPQAPVY